MEWDIALPLILSVSVPEVALLLTMESSIQGETERRFVHEKRRDKEALLELALSLKPLPEGQEDSHFFVQLCQREASAPAT